MVLLLANGHNCDESMNGMFLIAVYNVLISADTNYLKCLDKR